MAWQLRHRRRELRDVLVAAGAGVVPGAVMALAYNHVRWASGTDAGYPIAAADGTTVFYEHLWVGLWGLLLSPSKSLFLYSPPVLLALATLAGLRAPERRPLRATWLAIALAAGPVFLVNAKLPFWSGDLAWGPRYVVFLTGALIVPAVLWVNEAWQRRRTIALATAGAIAVAGVGVQLVGNALYWDAFIRVSQRARLDWLGTPNRTGAAFPDRGAACDPCIEDTYPFLYVPAFNPFELNWWLVKHVLREDPWQVAEADAPWKRYTKLTLNVAEPYRRAHLDWWYGAFRKDLPKTTVWFLVLFSGGLVASAGLWTWRLRGRAAIAPSVPEHASEVPTPAPTPVAITPAPTPLPVGVPPVPATAVPLHSSPE
jgi:hypothetical protein